ncbi:MAG: hypothetical protein QOJ86_1426, partial [Bradyrhizobium sp.]|nr:hypothetical protein [Bradyrhizobium sp.]
LNSGNEEIAAILRAGRAISNRYLLCSTGYDGFCAAIWRAVAFIEINLDEKKRLDASP